jgi:tripartite-type tricarboxylate transporter receptor subunit TctC
MKRGVGILAALAISVASAGAQAQQYPQRPMSLVVPFPNGLREPGYHAAVHEGGALASARRDDHHSRGCLSRRADDGRGRASRLRAIAVVRDARAREDATGNHIDAERAMRKALADPEVRRRITSEGGVPSPTSPEGLTQFVRAETAKYQKIAKAANLKIDE